MRCLSSFMVLLIATTATAYEFTSTPAKEDKAAYEQDLKTARMKYSEALDQAAIKAAQDGELDEIVRIKKIKEELSGNSKATSTKNSDKPKRLLWKHGNNYFEKLNDGHWVERVGDGNANIFAQSTVNERYIELSRAGALVRLYDDRADVLLKGRKGFKTFYRGGWRDRD